MNRHYFHSAVSTLVILLAIVACVLPGQAAPPAPAMDPLTIETAVAGTAQAAEQQTQQANPIPATETAAPTATITPTPKISVQGTSLIVQEDQSTLFIDHKLGFQLVIPAGWLTGRVNEEEYFKAFSLDVVLANPKISNYLTIMQTHNTDYFRLYAIDIRSDHIVDGIASSINVVHQPPEIAKTLEECLKVEKQSIRSKAGEKILSSEYQQTTNGTRVLIIEENLGTAPDTKAYRRIVFFNVPSGIVDLDLQARLDLKDIVLPDLEQAVNSFTLLTP